MKTFAALALLLAASLASAQQPDRTLTLLQRLADAPGPPGAEEAVRAIMVPEMKPFITEPLRYDGTGSVIAQQGTKGPRIMIDAHMDELGGMVRRVTPNGFLTMQMLGGWLDQALVDQRWIIIGSKGPVHAVTGIRDIHIVPAEERTRVFSRDSLYLDVGAKNAQEVFAMGVEAGDPVVPDSPFTVMNGTQNYLGKGWDDRIGCAVLLEAMRRTSAMPHPNQLFYVATTQEEVGLRGAKAASQLVKPDIGIAIEGGITGDTAGAHPEESQVKLGAGPGMFLYDSSTIPNRKLVAFTRAAARSASLPLQADLVQGYGDDSAEMQASSGGTPTINLVVPVRYTHSHNGIVNRQDFDRTVDLVVAMLMKLDAAAVADLRDFTPKP
ncbi:M42 family metallopeptidase [Granulicella tundricola]|uniref:Cellulase n=1 Tax=Granulicella tundricola (strain ATCC BAA-1859 / DSM 23138 / MP5ACTX9) TaxID=1198114 RepID=E8WW61_GRATM|nr:M42 family metallopeptidase [Granulicella tundricola]ADW67367.1 Cellulase [Granulicella tundricola MP5ACTX9]